MKKKMILFTVIALFLLIGGMGCEREDETYPDAVIVKELPILPIGNNRNSIVIQSQKELKAVYSSDILQHYDDLSNIDFSKYTLLLGYGGYGNEVSTMQHYFIKSGASSYTYLLKIAGDATCPDSFRYGIIVGKLPKAAKVTFKIEELRLEN